ncbi:unnamed protein product [Acanthoscelides obtectus]|uniref:Uncharacterized protein n=1 Tax=Acanthoscelides obtectus TaxID=200917 RepID=A0A9P0PMF6_ACAOB|nr:unnamed protein product [Acanthoscelides obtectus]CAK1675172.1 hypothetical protein AOBTE_LOCUS29994 [Acanthoscelides obtectus]
MATKLLTLAFIIATSYQAVTAQTQRNTFEILERIRRGYAHALPKEINADPSNVFSLWKPWPYALSRPYFIPVYGEEGKSPIYFPPQPFSSNPGTPPDNPVKKKRPFKGPQYLPPDKPATDGMKIGNRFQGDDEDEDVRPVWGTNPPELSLRPIRPPGFNTVPLSVDDNEIEPPPPPAGKKRPRPSDETPTTTPGSTATSSSTSLPGPSNCVWAVVSCCSVNTKAVPESCFEQRGCAGPFWGTSPCEGDFAKAAIDAALKYYGGVNA